MVETLFDFIARHATVGSKVTILDHQDGYIGTVEKEEPQQMALPQVGEVRAGLHLPYEFGLKEHQELGSKHLKGWTEVNEVLLENIRAQVNAVTERKREVKAKQKEAAKKPKELGWFKNGFTRKGTQLYECTGCGKNTTVEQVKAEHICSREKLMN